MRMTSAKGRLMKAQIILTLVVVLLTPLTVQANELYQTTLARMDQTAQLFIADNGFIEQSADELVGADYYSEKTFLEKASSAAAVFLPDADLDGLPRTILLLEAQEVELPHVRYHVNYNSYSDTEIPELKHEYIEVTRYNLGPARRDDLLQYVETEHIASPAEFGVGPHVSWRFALAPNMGMQASVLYAARKEITDSAAQQSMCFAQSCLSLEAPELPQGQTQVLAPTLLAPATYHAENTAGMTRPARVLEELWAELKSEDPLPYSKSFPQFVFVISMDVIGQDSLSIGAGLQTIVLDDSIAKVWLQRTQAAGMEPELTQVFISR